MSSPNSITATLIPGDGIGPETVESTIQILDALGSPFQWDVQQAGMAGIDALGDPLPEQTLQSIRKHRLALKGPLTTPVGGGFRSSNVRLREEFDRRKLPWPAAHCASCSRDTCATRRGNSAEGGT